MKKSEINQSQPISSWKQSYSEHWWWLSLLKKSWASSVKTEGKSHQIISFPPLDAFFNESCCVLLVWLNYLNSCCAESLQSERDTTVNPEKQAGLRGNNSGAARLHALSVHGGKHTHCNLCVCVCFDLKNGGNKKPPERWIQYHRQKSKMALTRH